jgi:Sporulation and spore germination/Immunoglobulin-like domain of bacterial spore germination
MRVKAAVLLFILILVAACMPATPTQEPAAPPTQPPAQSATITITVPQPGTTVSSPLDLRGSTSLTPFESTLSGRVYDASGQVIGAGPIMVNAPMGQPGEFAGQLAFVVPADGPGRIEVAEISAADGSVLASATVDIVLAAPTVPPGPTSPPHTIVIDAPQPGVTASSPVQVNGAVTVSPFESTLRGRIYDGSGLLVGETPITVDAMMGQPGSFSGQIAYKVRVGGPGRVEIAEISQADGSPIASASVDITLVAPPVSGQIEIPAASARVTLPLHFLARLGQPGEQVMVTLNWQDGTVLSRDFPIVAGEDGSGLLIGSLDWMMEGPPPQPPSQAATLAIHTQDGQLLASQPVTVLSANDPNVQAVTLYFILGETLQPVQRTIPTTEGIGAAALDELLWGPPPNNLAGFETAIPTPDQVLAYAGRGPDWGPRVTLNKLTIVDGLATADFSQEIKAYGGGSLRVKLLREQITQTLLQFPTIRQVVIAVNGQTEGVLEP